MKHTALLAAVFVSGSVALKGVAPEDEAKYVPDSDGMWACLSDPSIRIPFDRVNDDYCDCPDGSDEPGTGACAGVGNTKHYCANKGHLPAHIPVRYVNDGVCDYELCCDGSDEPDGDCPNRCAEVHDNYLKKRRAEEEAHRRGLAERVKLVEEGKVRKQWLEGVLVSRKQELTAKEAEVVQAKKDLEEAEQDAREHGVTAVDGKVIEAKAELARVAGTAERLRNDLIIAVERQRQLDAVLAKMKEEYNPNFNDPAVKQAIRSWEEITASGALSPDLSLASADAGTAILDDISTLSLTKPANAPFWSPIFAWIADVFGWDGGAPRPAGDFTSAKVDSAKTVLGERESELNDLRNQITQDEHTLNFNFGPDDVLRALAETCVKNKVGEYDYEVCIFGESRQIGNGQATLLGKFSKVEYAHNVFYLEFENGARCWNGPIRRAEVTVRCGESNVIVGVAEPEKCSYFIDMLSPGACSPHQAELEQVNHDEL